MQNKKTNTKTALTKASTSKLKSTATSMKSSQLMKLFESQLKNIYWSEKALTKAIPKMIKNATSKELVEALKSHVVETREHVERLVSVFASIGKKPLVKKCEAMEGIMKEGEEVMEYCVKGAMCDAGIISAAQKVDHYEIATYGTLRQFAEILDLKEAKFLLSTTLEEEKAIDEKLSKIAQSINIEAAEEESDTKIVSKSKYK
jgi:ferritin-like metal-binding protein YciE